MKTKKKTKALVLLSGGLDSLLSCKILQEQLGKKNVEAVFFILPFVKNLLENKNSTFQFCQKEGIKLHIVDVTKGKLFEEYLKIIKKPEFSRGTALNPCIDCHIFMLKKAKDLAEKNNINIIATGEVLGERPLSQNKKALLLIEKEAGLKGKLLRPLSAKLLPETFAEKKGLIDRNKLLDVQGRQRKRQISLARKYGISFPNPAGGCLLCEKDYCKKLKSLLEKKNLCYEDIKLLSVGRHFEESQIILGKNKEENMLLEKEKGLKILPDKPGPTALIRAWKDNEEELIKKAKELIQGYSKHKVNEFKTKK